MKTDGYNIARDLLNTFDKKDMNEANTRHKIIDELLHNVLHWPKKLVDCERYIKPGFSDYILLKNNAPFFLIEAKKEGIYFSFPITFNFKKNFEHMKVKQLLSDTNIEDTMMQARSYCMKTEIIIEFAAITNGNQITNDAANVTAVTMIARQSKPVAMKALMNGGVTHGTCKTTGATQCMAVAK